MLNVVNEEEIKRDSRFSYMKESGRGQIVSGLGSGIDDIVLSKSGPSGTARFR